MPRSPVVVANLPPAVRLRVQWRRLLHNLNLLRKGDPAEVVDAAFSVGDAIGGMSQERQMRRIFATPEGQALWQHKESLSDALSDHAALASMPPGSLGRVFLAFCRRHGLVSRDLVEHQHAMSRDYHKLDPVRQWWNDRHAVMHDILHVLAGYDATHAGESALMCFSLPHRLNDRALPIFVMMSVFVGHISVRNAWEAIVRGRRAGFLVGVAFEDLLALPLDEVRERLGISPLDVGHPVVTSEAMLIPVEST